MKGDLRVSTLVRWRLRVRAAGAARGLRRGVCGAGFVRFRELRAGPRFPLESGFGPAGEPARPCRLGFPAVGPRRRPFGLALLRTELHNRKPARVCFVLLSLLALRAEG